MSARPRVDPHQVTSTRKPIETKRDYRSAPAVGKKPAEQLIAAKRPGHGTKGDPIALLVNWFRIAFQRRTIYIYKITVTEEGQGKKGPKEITHPEIVSRIFWRAVRNYPKIFPDVHRLTFDDKKYACTPDDFKQGGKLFCRHPDKEGVEVRVDFNYEDQFELDLRGGPSSNPNNVQFASIFLKNLLSQNTRYCPGEDATNREKELSQRFAHLDGAMFIVPRSPEQHLKYNITGIEPGVNVSLGLFASVRVMETSEAVIQFGHKNMRLVQPNLNLITFYRLIEGESLSEIERPVQNPARLCMSPGQARNFTNKLKGLKLQCARAPLIENGFATGVVERHYRFVGLKEDTCADREYVKVEDSRAASRFVKNIPAGRDKDGKPKFKQIFKRWRDVTMHEWYNTNKVKLEYPKLPLCIVKQTASSTRQDLIPMELLFTHYKLQKFLALISFYARMKITKALARSPVQTHKYTNELVRNELEYDKDPFMDAMNISLDPQMVECEGRVVEPCAILAKDRVKDEVIKLELNKESGEFKLSRGIETSKKQIRFLVYKLTTIHEEYAKEFYRELVKRCVNRGFDVPACDHENPPIWKNVTIDEQDPLQISRMIEEHRVQFHKLAKTEDQILVFIFITKLADDLYGQIKYLCDIEYGVVSQVVDADSIIKTVSKEGEKPSDIKSIYHHICLKLNAKLGGVNHILAEPDEPEYGRMPSHKRTMFIGIDVIHPSPNSPIRDCSLAAIVANLDDNAARYAARIKVNSRCNETVQQFDEHFAHLLQQYHAESYKFDKAGYMPERIVILRDGVSDSEMLTVASEEWGSIKYAWDKTANGRKCPPITYIIVQKNHKTRFFKRPEGENGKVSNPPQGTVVDKGAVTPHMFDFYMVSHTTLLGTTRPIHYTVVKDECNSSADSIQEMLFRLCFLYARCSKPVSLPAPVYYAHLACERAALHHQYAIQSERVREIEDRRPDEKEEQQYADRVELQAQRIEKRLQVNKDHPGMYFI